MALGTEILKQRIRRESRITLVMGLAGSGKSYLLSHLPQKDTISLFDVTIAGLDYMQDEIKKVSNIILHSEYQITDYERDQLIKVAKKLSEMGKHVYIHCYPKDWNWIKKVFED